MAFVSEPSPFPLENIIIGVYVHEKGWVDRLDVLGKGIFNYSCAIRVPSPSPLVSKDISDALVDGFFCARRY